MTAQDQRPTQWTDRECDICGATPCANRSFCRQCRIADRNVREGKPARFTEPLGWDTL